MLKRKKIIKEEDLSSKDLLAEISRLKKDLKKKKKYGLVWEEKKEDVVEMCKEKLPILVEDKNKAINEAGVDEPINILIEGDNYHALCALNYTHEGKIDVIYIDPPYNTGNKSWKYNNYFVEKDNAFKHSLWINMMYKRIKSSKKLLTQSGIILVAIDDYEHQNLRLILDDLFGENNRLGTLVVVHNPGGRSDDEFIATSHEYLLIYAKKKENAKINLFNLTTQQEENFKHSDEISSFKLQSFMRTGSNSRPDDRPNLFYPIYYNLQEKKLSLKKKNSNFKKIEPIDASGNKRVWRWGKESFELNKDTEFVVTESKNKFKVKLKKRLNNSSGTKPKTIWNDPKYNASTHGTILLQNILNEEKPFNFPKSLFSVLDALKISTQKNSIVLDYFAGSGTTGHAVLELNKNDHGNRKFILVTNNENNICRNVCYPRLTKVIKGYKNKKNVKVAGISGNLKYYNTEFVDAKQSDKNKKILTKKATEMLCIKEDTFDEVRTKNNNFKIFKNGNKFTGIIYDYMEIKSFIDIISKLDGKLIVYVFSLGGDTFEEEFEELGNKVKLSPIPESIMRVYRRVFK